MFLIEVLPDDSAARFRSDIVSVVGRWMIIAVMTGGGFNNTSYR